MTLTTVLPINPNDASSVSALMAIYQDALEISEQKPVGTIEALLHDARYAIIGAFKDTALLGFAMSIFPSGADFWLLEYMAVSDQARSVGIGGKLFRAALAIADRRAPGCPCLIEVDQLAHDSEAAAVRTSRLRFYARHSCRRIVNLKYIMPAVAGVAPPPMHLLIHGLSDENDVAVAKLHSWLATIYREVYGRSADDDDIRVGLEPLPF